MVGELGRLIQAHKDAQKYRVYDAAIARELGVSRSIVGKWKRGESMPGPENLRALATLLEEPYQTVLNAALRDAGYGVVVRSDLAKSPPPPPASPPPDDPREDRAQP